LLNILTIKDSETDIANKEYLDSKLDITDSKILDQEKNGVMMGWEEPLMKEHAKIICTRKGNICSLVSTD
jgi:protein arginine N-methyltransferase 2